MINIIYVYHNSNGGEMLDKKAISIILSIFMLMAIVPVIDQQTTQNTHTNILKTSDLPVLEAASKYKYVGSENSNVFHKLSCRYVKKIKKYNKIYFKTKKEAKRDGYRSCKVCRP